MCGMVVSVSRLGVWKGGAMPAEAPRECVKEVMLRGVRERGRSRAEREGEKVIWRVDFWVGEIRSAVAAEQEKMVEKF